LRGDKTIQQIASKHKVHSNQVSTWKRQAIEGLGQVFSGKTDKARKNQEAEIHELHAKACARACPGYWPVDGGTGSPVRPGTGFLAKGLKG
jgi:transposase-like protein